MAVPRPLAFLVWAAMHACFAQAATEVQPPACTNFLGQWSGTWSQGYYGTQRIHVTHVTDKCIATLAYSPTEAAPTVAHQFPIKDGFIAFGCNVPGGTCHLEVVGAELRFTYTDPSGFVNNGVFRKDLAGP
jgi:hypothetical protein